MKVETESCELLCLLHLEKAGSYIQLSVPSLQPHHPHPRPLWVLLSFMGMDFNWNGSMSTNCVAMQGGPTLKSAPY